MKLLFTQARDSRAGGADDNLGRGMETALLLAVFLGIGWLVDRWLGTRPLFMIGLVLFAAAGSALIFHLKNHYALIYALREWTSDGKRVRQLLCARKGQRPSAWVDWLEALSLIHI